MLPRLIGENIEYLFVPEPQLGRVRADPGQIEQVVLNLAVNARDAMPDGGKILVKTINVEMDEAGARHHAPMTAGSYVLLSVSDTGHGMDEKTKAHIFEPFFTTKETGKGTGLGLATVYGVVKQSGGFIWVESAPGQGATFEIYLPVAKEALSEPEKASSVPTRAAGKETILVVEDETGVRELACEFLKASGYAVLEAGDGVEALQLVAEYKGQIHLVLTDVVMPRMSGRELENRMKHARPGVKVLLMSGYSEHFQAPERNSEGESEILQKPFSMSSLAARIREVLSGATVAQQGNARDVAGTHQREST
jgi:two-component system cell cycle sensor histidine kinase/response regulator CckA